MKSTKPDERAIKAAQEALRKKIHDLVKASVKEPSYDESLAWEEKHPSPRQRYCRKIKALESGLQERADDLILAARMGQITSEDLYAKTKAF